MDVYLTERLSGKGIALSMLPEQIKSVRRAAAQQYEILHAGELRRPAGAALALFSWKGVFPAAPGSPSGFMKSEQWKSPTELAVRFDHWCRTGTVLVLLATIRHINLEVLLTSFHTMCGGGNGEITYEAAFAEYRALRLQTVAECSGEAVPLNTAARPAPVPPRTYTVVMGDSLWSIAQRFLGSGAKYRELYALNKESIGKDPNLIFPGLVLTLPDGGS